MHLPIRLLLILLGVVMCALVTASFLWGILFPYSPIIIGFHTQEFARVVVYQEHGFPAKDYRWIDEMIPTVEEFHNLRFSDKPRIFIFGDAETYADRSISKARLCAFFNGDIVVSPKVVQEDAEGRVSLQVYLRHELSHSVLYQNMSYLNLLSYPRWLLEGIATYSANQMGQPFYPSREETLNLIGQGNWVPPDLFDSDAEERLPLAVEYRQPFQYAEFACLVGDLIDRYGRETFLRYMKALLTERNHDAVFARTYGISFADFLASFQRSLAQTDQ